MHCFGQKTGTITYKKISNPIDLTKADISIQEQLVKTSKESDKIEYVLNFNEFEVYFYAKKILLQENMFNAYVIIGGGKLKLYQNKKTQESREYIDSKRVGQVILNKKVLYDWTLTNESKNIDGYKCFKATSPYFKEDGTKNENPNLMITAWYCPEIPVKLGPLGYGDLPGLIIELQTKMSTFVAKTINLNPEIVPEIDKLTSQKAISEETYKEMYMGTLNKEQYNAVKESEVKQKK